MTTLRIVLALAAAKQWHVKQLDVDTAFLHGDLHEEVYMKLPPGLDGTNLNSSLFASYRSRYHSLHSKITPRSITIIMVYVDDLVLTGNNLTETDHVKKLLDNKFKIKDLGDLKYFLGMEMARNSKGIHLCQRKYALDIIKEFGYLNCKSVSTPMDYTYASKLSKESGIALQDHTPYRQLIGRLLYLTNTRHDISYAIGRLSQLLDCPTDAHMHAAYRVLRYLKGCPSLEIFFSSANDLKLTGFCDADWATCVDTRQSITGHCFYLGNSLISWKSKKQSTVARLSSEAEYRALAAAICQAQWLSFVMKDISVPLTEPITLFCDNRSAIHLATYPVFHERTKHIEVDCHISRNQHLLGLIHLMPSPLAINSLTS
ncbi:uncharacterized mitochondrial protein AtMg00810-like [Arachis duranensis]|uniref:Uncharacterized mitochondrial protein AtMg00810-like n=1 Tax=Arachis duranensis TaxID=130453 RepID=A0A6P4D709_ARADU|nr:uncharacterized mitochondrial protein AtMg00810-like [Arachis duranensis]